MLQELKDILILQKRELEKRFNEKYISRESKIKGLESDLIKIIMGPRRAGKSFFSIHYLRNSNFGYINFDDEKLINLNNYDELISAINLVYNNPKILLFDEIQNLENWELFVNRLQRQGYNLIITGSNSKLLAKKLATHLTGRHFQIYIFPFSFKEYIKLDNKELTTLEIKEKLTNFLIVGGYPEPYIKNLDYVEYLRTLFNSIIYKDIIKRYSIRATNEIDDLALFLLSNITKEYSYLSLTKNIKIKSSHTVKKYINYLEESFIFFNVNRFSYKLKEQLRFNKKIYCLDNGFIQSKAFKLSPDIGKLYENLVAVELKRRELNNQINIYYWKNEKQEEIDFVIKEGIKIKQLVQVCFNIKNQKTKNREIKALVKGSKELKCDNLLIITDDYENEENIDKKLKIRFIPLWKWLLD